MTNVDIGTIYRKFAPATFVTASTTTEEINLNGGTLCGIITPSNLTGTALTFTVSNTLGGTYVGLNDGGAGSAISITVTTSKAYSISPLLFAGWQYIKVVSNAAANGDAGKTIILAVKDIA